MAVTIALISFLIIERVKADLGKHEHRTVMRVRRANESNPYFPQSGTFSVAALEQLQSPCIVFPPLVGCYRLPIISYCSCLLAANYNADAHIDATGNESLLQCALYLITAKSSAGASWSELEREFIREIAAVRETRGSMGSAINVCCLIK